MCDRRTPHPPGFTATPDRAERLALTAARDRAATPARPNASSEPADA